MSGRTEPFTVLDVGSGAGLPGIPLRIALDDLPHAKNPDGPPALLRVRIRLLDALAKRVGFLEEVIRTLDLMDIEALHARAEDAAHGPLREHFDFVVARAVAPLNVLLEYGLPYVRVGGLFVAMKGPDPADETAAAARASPCWEDEWNARSPWNCRIRRGARHRGPSCPYASKNPVRKAGRDRLENPRKRLFCRPLRPFGLAFMLYCFR